MLSRRLRERTPSARLLGVGYVVKRRLTFDKVSDDGSGKCDIAPTDHPTDRVYGVLFKIKHSEKPLLDDLEGLDKGYTEETLTVSTDTGSLKARGYVATAKEPTLRPYHWYKALVVAGATEHDLPAPYIEWLRTFDSKPDANEPRRTLNEALLFGSPLPAR
jgi:gamma-glutamylcyclotransferase